MIETGYVIAFSIGAMAGIFILMTIVSISKKLTNKDENNDK